MEVPIMYNTVEVACAPFSYPAQQPHAISPQLLVEIERIEKQAEWMERLLEDDERMFTYGEDGTIEFGLRSQRGDASEMFSYQFAYNMSLFRPSYGACFYINEQMHRV